MISIQLPDGSKREYPGPVTVAEVAASIGTGLAKAALAGRVGQGNAARVVDTSHRIESDTLLSIITDKDAAGLEVIRHSTAHLLAYAVKELFPDAQVTIGPVIENGFFYDFAYKRPFTPEDLVAIEAKMTELARKDERVERRVLPRDEAVAHFKNIGEAYKAGQPGQGLGSRLKAWRPCAPSGRAGSWPGRPPRDARPGRPPSGSPAGPRRSPRRPPADSRPAD